jgi:hypothetical protein
MDDEHIFACSVYPQHTVDADVDTNNRFIG